MRPEAAQDLAGNYKFTIMIMHTVNGISENGFVHASQQGCAIGSVRAYGQVLQIPIGRDFEKGKPETSPIWAYVTSA